jgi:hypothetical protein
MEMCLASRCLAIDYPGFQASYHNISVVSYSRFRKLCNWSATQLVTASEYSVTCSPMVLILLMLTSVWWVMNSAWFQQGGARPHTNNAILLYLHDVFEETVLSNRYPTQFEEGFSWPSSSPDLNTCGYFLWGTWRTGYIRIYCTQFHSWTLPSNESSISTATLEQFYSSFP